MAQQRAKAGGEIGANGEFYEGGKFIATTDHAKRIATAKRATGRQQVEPGKWECAPSGMRSIFQRWSGLWTRTDNSQVIVNPGANVDYWGADTLAQAAEWAAKYNAGERWMPE